MTTLALSPTNDGDIYQVNGTDAVHLVLEENPTTGYVWHFLSESGVFTVEKDQYQLQGGIGGSSLRELFIRFPAPGIWPVTFFLKREWESDVAKAERFTVTFEVREDS